MIFHKIHIEKWFITESHLEILQENFLKLPQRAMRMILLKKYYILEFTNFFFFSSHKSMANILEKVLPQDSQFTLTWSLQKMICHNCHNPFPVGLRPDARKCFFESGYILCFKISKKIFRNFFRKMLNPGFFFSQISVFRFSEFSLSRSILNFSFIWRKFKVRHWNKKNSF